MLFFIHGINKQAYYETEESVKESVLKGKTYASIVVPQNFSESLQARIEDWRSSNVADIYSSEITVFRDVSSSLVSQYLRKLIYDTFKHFLDDYMTMCNIDSKWLTSPIRLEKPVYGENKPTFIDFVSPAILLSTVSFLAAALTCMALFLERNEGILERCLVIGISQVEMLLSHLICLSAIMVSQSLITLVCFFAIFNITMKGSLILVTILTLMVGFFGMCGGLLISSIANAEAPAFLATMGSYMVVVTLSGVLWPIEGMHYLLRYIAVVLPFTQTTETARNIMHRGWDLTHATVYMGFLSIIVWTIIIVVIIILVLKYKKE